MRAKKNTRAIKTLLFLGGFIMNVTAFSQTGKVWAQIDNISSIEIQLKNGRLNSSNVEINEMFQSLDVASVERALPASRDKKLQNVYEFTCNCDENILLQEIARKSLIFKDPVIAPTYTSLGAPNDYSLAFANDYALNLINAQGAWDISTGDPSIVIAISDGNYYTNHEELVGKYDYITPNNSSSDYNHGTAVAITAAGNTNNYLGKSSIGYNSRLQLRMMNYNDVLEASYSGARVINISWTSGCYYNSYCQDVMNEVYNNGTVVIAAAGNGATCGGSSNLVYPAAHDHVIAVSSVGPSDNHQRYIGDLNSTHQHNSSVDICAPGYDVALTVSPNWYLTGNGTSFAAPYVSGTVALMLATNPCLTPDDIELILKTTAVNIDAMNPMYIGNLGSGRLNAAAAVLMASTYNKLQIDAIKSINCTDYSQSVNLDVKSGIAPYEINWSNNQTGTLLSNVQPDTLYTAIIKDSTGCVGTYSVSFNAISPLTLEANIYGLKCHGDENASIELFVEGGESNYNFLWNTGDTAKIIYDLAVGNYSVNVTDKNGCQISEYITITQPDVLIGGATSQNVGFNQLGSIDVTVTGGTSPYNFNWNNGFTSEDLTGLLEGFYEVEIIDAKGCLASVNVILSSNNVEEVNNGIVSIESDTTAEETSSAGISAVNNINSTEMSIYPNPASENTTVEWGGIDVELIQLYNVQGQVLQTIEIDSNINMIQINSVPSGEYFVRLSKSNGEQLIKKLIFL